MAGRGPGAGAAAVDRSELGVARHVEPDSANTRWDGISRQSWPADPGRVHAAAGRAVQRLRLLLARERLGHHRARAATRSSHDARGAVLATCGVRRRPSRRLDGIEMARATQATGGTVCPMRLRPARQPRAVSRMRRGVRGGQPAGGMIGRAMRRIVRHVFTFAAVLSALLSVGLCALWARSYRSADAVSRLGPVSWVAESNRARVSLTRRDHTGWHPATI